MAEKLSDKWETPDSIFLPAHAAFNFDLDAAAEKRNAKVPHYLGLDAGALGNALEVYWPDFGHRIFVNPPLSKEAGPVTRWVQKMDEAARGGCLVFAVLQATPNAGWFHEYIAHKAAIWMPDSRIKYVPPPGIPTTYTGKDGKKKRRNGARHDSMIALWVGDFGERGVWL